MSNTSGSATGSGAVSVISNNAAVGPTTLASGSTATISNTVTTGGKTFSAISPGGSTAIGMLTLGGLNANGTTAANSGSSFTFNLGATSGGTSSDLLAVNGALAAPSTGTGGLAFNFVNGGATVGTTYTLITYTSSSNLDINDLTSTGVAGMFNITNMTGGPGEIDFTVAAVPEPSTFVSGTLLAVSLGWYGLRRRRSHLRQAV